MSSYLCWTAGQKNERQSVVRCSVRRSHCQFYSYVTSCFLIKHISLWCFSDPESIDRNIIFQHDHAPLNLDNVVPNFLNQNFTNRWIRKVGRKEVPYCSLNTSLIFSFSGYVKQKIHNEPITGIQQLLETLMQDASFVKVKMSSSMARSLPEENLLKQNVGPIINYLQ